MTHHEPSPRGDSYHDIRFRRFRRRHFRQSAGRLTHVERGRCRSAGRWRPGWARPLRSYSNSLRSAASSSRAPGRRTDQYLSTLAGSSVAIIATPVYKASYTGLLKSFLDLYPAGGLSGVVTVPLLVSASPAHLRAADGHLRSVLSELGTGLPTSSVTLVEAELGSLDVTLSEWAARSLDAVSGAVDVLREDADRVTA